MQDYQGNVISIHETSADVAGGIEDNGMLTLEVARRLFSYDPAVGSLLWRVGGFRRTVGGEAGVIRNGYRFVTVEGQEHMAARIAWLLTHGEWPATRVRFRGDSTDIRLENMYVDAFKWQTKAAKNQQSRDRRIADPDYFKNADLKKDFGITLERYTEMLAEQKGVCAICDRPEMTIRLGKLKMLCVDHHHETNAVRGLLCHECNMGIGKLGDDAARIRRAADYIEKHAGMVVPIRKENSA